MSAHEEPLELDAVLVERLNDYCASEGLSPQEGFETALGLGLELCLSGSARRDDRLKAIEVRLGEMAETLQAMGPPVLGVLRLLVAWAAREGFKVGEEELMAELLAAAQGDWGLALAERGVVPPLGGRSPVGG